MIREPWGEVFSLGPERFKGTSTQRHCYKGGSGNDQLDLFRIAAGPGTSRPTIHIWVGRGLPSSRQLRRDWPDAPHKGTETISGLVHEGIGTSLRHRNPSINRETTPPPVFYRPVGLPLDRAQFLILIRDSMAVTRARTTIVSAVNTGSGVGINGKDTCEGCAFAWMLEEQQSQRWRQATFL